MNIPFSIFLGSLLCAMTASLAAAHSMQDAMNELRHSEPYLQPVHQVAPEFALEDAWDRQHRLADYRGKVVVMNFIYARCKEACPLHSVLLAKIQQQIKAAAMQDQVQFVTIATDIEDAASTVAIMRNYGQTYNLDPENWVLLSGGSNNAPGAGIKAAKTYGLDFVVVSGEEQMHGVVTHVIDQQGIMKARFHGLRFKPEHLTTFVSNLLRPEHDEALANAGSTPHRWWEAWKHQWLTGLLLIPGLALLVLSGIRLKRLKARRGADAPALVNAMPDAVSSRLDS